MDQIINSVTTILAAVIGVAILSVIVSKNSNTSGVINAGASGFSSILSTAESPVTGSSGLGSLTSLPNLNNGSSYGF